MSTDVTMQELELEQAELLPSRETLCRPNPCWHPCYPCHPCFEVVFVFKSCW
jgi:hypothetical protein